MAKGRSNYNDEDKAKVYVALVGNDGNLRRTARETGISVPTLSKWKKDWDENGLPESIAGKVPKEVDAFVSKAEEVIELGLARAKQLIPELGPTQFAAIGTMIGILSDKVARAKGLPTSKTEVTHNLPDPTKLREILAEYTGIMRGETQDRTKVLDVEVVREQSAKELTP